MRQLHKINNRQKVICVYAGKKKSRIKHAEQNQNKLKHRGTLHEEEHPRRLPQAPSENLTFWAGTGILLPRCLPPAHIEEEKKKRVNMLCRQNPKTCISLVWLQKAKEIRTASARSCHYPGTHFLLGCHLMFTHDPFKSRPTRIFATAGFSRHSHFLPMTPAKHGRPRAKHMA